MGLSKEGRLVRKLSDRGIQKQNPISPEMFLPNTSNVANYARKDMPNSSGLTEGSIIFINSIGQLAQDNQNLFWDDTNNRIGIGTNSPTSKVDIVGTVNADIQLKVKGAGSQSVDMFEVVDSDSNIFLRVESDGDFRIGSNSFFVDRANDKVGVGITPAEALTVKGTIDLSVASGAQILDRASTATVPTLVPNKGSTNSGIGGGSGTVSLITGGTQAIGINTGQNITATAGSITVSGTGLTDFETGLKVKSNTSATNWARIDMENVNESGGTFFLYQQQNGDGNIRNGASKAIIFRIGSTTAMYIEASTDVGVGTTVPLAKLHVDQASTTAGEPTLYLDQADVSGYVLACINSNSLCSTSYKRYCSTSSTYS